MNEQLQAYFDSQHTLAKHIVATSDDKDTVVRARAAMTTILDVQRFITEEYIKFAPSPMVGIHVQRLWAIDIRRLAMTRTGREPFTMHVGTRQHGTEQEAVDAIRLKYTEGWWRDKLITDVREVGELHVVNGVALYEETNEGPHHQNARVRG